jgi:hypothetical protein
MNRRQFVDRGIMGLAGLWTANHLGSGVLHAEPSEDKLQIPYVRSSIPEFQVPPYSGDFYDDTVPDTLDLAERLRLAVHASTSIADPRADDEVFWAVDLLHNPPVNHCRNGLHARNQGQYGRVDFTGRRKRPALSTGIYESG